MLETGTVHVVDAPPHDGFGDEPLQPAEADEQRGILGIYQPLDTRSSDPLDESRLTEYGERRCEEDEEEEDDDFDDEDDEDDFDDEDDEDFDDDDFDDEDDDLDDLDDEEEEEEEV